MKKIILALAAVAVVGSASAIPIKPKCPGTFTCPPEDTMAQAEPVDPFEQLMEQMSETDPTEPTDPPAA